MSRKNHGNRSSFPVLPTATLPLPPPPGNPERRRWVTTPRPASPGSAKLPPRQRILVETVTRERASKKKKWIVLRDWYDKKTSKLLYARPAICHPTARRQEGFS